MTPASIFANLHLWSIVLGVLAWLMGIWAIGKYKPWKMTLGYFFCAVALLLQLIAVKQSDYSSILDTIGAVIFAGIFMLAVTVILHVVAFIKCKTAQRRAKKEAAN